MATYAIGDVQGCADALARLLKQIHYCYDDELYFCGDLVNRGPDSLAVMEIVMSLPKARTVLGNHDVYFLALSLGWQKSSGHTLDTVLNSSKCDQIVAWLLRQSFVIEKAAELIVHAGIPPQWSLASALAQADKLIRYLRENFNLDSVTKLFGNEPSLWQPGLSLFDNLRYSLNAFTRMRFCDQQGRLDFTKDGLPEEAPVGYQPWYRWASKLPDQTRVIFGHWAALDGQSPSPKRIATDTGCVWGRKLSAFRLEDGQYFSVPALA